MSIEPFKNYIDNYSAEKPLIISGPCSAESQEQVLETARQIKKHTNTSVFRAGIWKPRSRPGTFEGIGELGLKWLQEVKSETDLMTAVEVANPEHINLALKYGIDILWIGARTTSNPFSMQEIAQSLKGVDVPIFVKNPINPDVSLWLGAFERILNTGNKKVAAIHRGFYPYEETKLRNIPKWEIPIEIKRIYKELPMICDPSHIAGNTQYIEDICQKALDLNFDGLMIETHITPQKALSDAQQQVTPQLLQEILGNLVVRTAGDYTDDLQQYREQIDSIDQQLLEMLAQRMDVIKKIGDYKKDRNVSILQLRRWENIIASRTVLGEKAGLNASFIKDILQLIHKESIKEQNRVMNRTKD